MSSGIMILNIKTSESKHGDKTNLIYNRRQFKGNLRDWIENPLFGTHGYQL